MVDVSPIVINSVSSSTTFRILGNTAVKLALSVISKSCCVGFLEILMLLFSARQPEKLPINYLLIRKKSLSASKDIGSLS